MFFLVVTLEMPDILGAPFRLLSSPLSVNTIVTAFAGADCVLSPTACELALAAAEVRMRELELKVELAVEANERTQDLLAAEERKQMVLQHALSKELASRGVGGGGGADNSRDLNRTAQVSKCLLQLIFSARPPAHSRCWCENLLFGCRVRTSSTYVRTLRSGYNVRTSST
jgi:hypothetical protein